MTSKTRRHLKWIPSLAVALFLASSAAMKLVNAPDLVALFSRIGMADHLLYFAFAELTLLGMFLVPKTMKIGLLLLTGYFGGAMAVELSLGHFPAAPTMILSLVWVAAYCRDKSVFQLKAAKPQLKTAHS